MSQNRSSMKAILLLLISMDTANAFRQPRNFLQVLRIGEGAPFVCFSEFRVTPSHWKTLACPLGGNWVSSPAASKVESTHGIATCSDRYDSTLSHSPTTKSGMQNSIYFSKGPHGNSWLRCVL